MYSDPIDRQELETLAHGLARVARRSFLREGHHPPTVYLLVSERVVSIGVPMSSEEDKAGIRAFLEMAARDGADACAFIFEAWSGGGDRQKLAEALAWRQAGRSLADMTGRREVLVVQVASPAGLAIRQFVIARSGGRVTLKAQRSGKSRTVAFSAFLSGLPWRATSGPDAGRKREGFASNATGGRPRLARPASRPATGPCREATHKQKRPSVRLLRPYGLPPAMAVIPPIAQPRAAEPHAP
jgi:hypothetical protein